MVKSNLVFGVLSLLLGAAMVSLALWKQGLSATVGLVFGSLLLVNAALRLWSARSS